MTLIFSYPFYPPWSLFWLFFLFRFPPRFLWVPTCELWLVGKLIRISKTSPRDIRVYRSYKFFLSQKSHNKRSTQLFFLTKCNPKSNHRGKKVELGFFKRGTRCRYYFGPEPMQIFKKTVIFSIFFSFLYIFIFFSLLYPHFYIKSSVKNCQLSDAANFFAPKSS